MKPADIIERLTHVIEGHHIVHEDLDSIPLVSPTSTEQVATVLGMASDEGWRVRIQGNSSWLREDAPADLALTTSGISTPMSVRREDLVATVPAGLRWAALTGALAKQQVWLPIDPPGQSRTVGSVLATASTGPLRSGFGGVRDHVLGLTFVTGNGKIVTVGGEVVKNVAGFDLAKMIIGSFGAFGCITSANLRLRAIPQAQASFLSEGSRATLLERAWFLLDNGLNPASLELIAPDNRLHDPWTLAVRIMGSEGSVNADSEVFAQDRVWRRMDADTSTKFWPMIQHGMAEGPVGIRIGSLIRDVKASLDLVERLPAFVTASVAVGVTRANGHLTLDDISRVRRIASENNQPVTIERAPWSILKTAGHVHTNQKLVTTLTENLMATFNPNRIIPDALVRNS